MRHVTALDTEELSGLVLTVAVVAAVASMGVLPELGVWVLVGSVVVSVLAVGAVARHRWGSFGLPAAVGVALVGWLLSLPATAGLTVVALSGGSPAVPWTVAGDAFLATVVLAHVQWALPVALMFPLGGVETEWDRILAGLLLVTVVVGAGALAASDLPGTARTTYGVLGYAVVGFLVMLGFPLLVAARHLPRRVFALGGGE